jgi:hypothetical protein
MIPEEFLEWLNAKFVAYTKLVPPVEVMRGRLEKDVRDKLEEEIKDKVLEEADIDAQVDEAFEELRPDIDRHTIRLIRDVKKALEHDRARPWTAPVGDIAGEIVS